MRKKEHENLSHAEIRKVVNLLEAETPITKKEACVMLNITYNTTRLAKIVEDFHEREAYIKKRKEQKKGQPADNSEITEVVLCYFREESLVDIATRQYRSLSFIERLVDNIGLPIIRFKKDRKGPALIPDKCIGTSFEPKEVVWSAADDCLAYVSHELSIDYQVEHDGFKAMDYEEKYGAKCYSLLTFEGYYTYALAYDIGKLEHLKQYGVDFNNLNR